VTRANSAEQDRGLPSQDNQYGSRTQTSIGKDLGKVGEKRSGAQGQRESNTPRVSLSKPRQDHCQNTMAIWTLETNIAIKLPGQVEADKITEDSAERRPAADDVDLECDHGGSEQRGPEDSLRRSACSRAACLCRRPIQSTTSTGTPSCDGGEDQGAAKARSGIWTCMKTPSTKWATFTTATKGRNVNEEEVHSSRRLTALEGNILWIVPVNHRNCKCVSTGGCCSGGFIPQCNSD
jgi:hypothetical protein